MEQIETVSSFNIKSIILITLSIIISSILITTIFLFVNMNYKNSSTESLKFTSKEENISTTISTIISREQMHQLSLFKEFLNLSSLNSNPNIVTQSINQMNKFMRKIYRDIYDETNFRRKKRDNIPYDLPDDIDYLISLPNQYNSHSTNELVYQFQYNSSLEHLFHAEFILPNHHHHSTLTKISILSEKFNLSINPTLSNDRNWLKVNLTQYITLFPLRFNLKINKRKALYSSGFLTLHFRQSSHILNRRHISSFYENQLVTYPDDPSHCQVRPLRASFSELKWSSWVVEPSSYEMNICSGTCHTGSNMDIYFLIQNLLNQKYPNKIPAPCCKPKRFSSTILLYYDGSNLILKRHENMRVVECGCFS